MITPSSLLAFMEALNGKKGDLDAWLECNDEAEVREYARLALAQERERCAQVCDNHAERNFPWGSENSDIYHAQAAWAERCAKAIRALEEPK